MLCMALLALGILSSPANAQLPKIFVASAGNDTNDGGRTTPKRSFQAAHDAVAAGGEIVVLDTAGYGNLTVTKSVAIVVPPGISGFVTVTSRNTNGITVNAAPTDTVILRGLIIEGKYPKEIMNAGIYVKSVGTIIVEDNAIQGFFDGMVFSSSLSTKAIVNRSAVKDTSFGILIGDTADNAKIEAIVSDTEVTNNYIGLGATKGNPNSVVRLIATRNRLSGSSTHVVDNSGGEIVVDDCIIASSNQAFSVTASGVTFTRNNNTISGSAIGMFPTPLPGQ